MAIDARPVITDDPLPDYYETYSVPSGVWRAINCEPVLLGSDTSPGLERGPVGEGLPERTVRCRVDPADIKPRNFPDAVYDPSRDKPDAPVLDVWGEPLSVGCPKPAWPSKQRIGLFLPE